MGAEWQGVTLDQAKAWLRRHVEEGAHCPCCGQMAKVYPRRIHSSMARALIKMYRAPGAWVRLTDILEHRQIVDAAKLRYWGLIEEEQERRPDGGRAGWWGVTEAGRAFVEGRATVTKYARIYDGRCLRMTGPEVGITDALGDAFDYDELMSA